MDAATQRIISALLLLFIALLTGIVGYQLIEGWSAFDALYMTVITLASVGYGETHPLGTTGRVFTIFLIMFGVGTIAYGLTAVTAFVVEGALTDILGRRRMEAEISKLNDHIILCGIGETGRHIAEEFIKVQVPFVVVDRNEERIKEVSKIGRLLYIVGDATDDEVLLKAGVQRAKGLATALPSDKDNLFVILTARGLNPNLRIVAEAIELEDRAKLAKVGADAIVAPSFIGGLRMASEMIRPTVVSFLDRMLRASGDAVRVEEVRIPPGSKLAGCKLRDAGIHDKTGLVVIAVARGDKFELNPGPHTELREGDGLIVCCSVEQLEKLRRLVAA